jgi:hypothetical protein
MALPKKHAQKVTKAKAPITIENQTIISYTSSPPQGISLIFECVAICQW